MHAVCVYNVEYLNLSIVLYCNQSSRIVPSSIVGRACQCCFNNGALWLSCSCPVIVLLLLCSMLQHYDWEQKAVYKSSLESSLGQARREGIKGESFPGPRDVWGPRHCSEILKRVFQMASFWPQICIKSIFGRGKGPGLCPGPHWGATTFPRPLVG